MFDSFKQVKVYCANEDELNNLMRWLYNGRIGLSQAARGVYPVDVILPKLQDMAEGNAIIRGYYVRIPLDEVKPRMNRLTVQDAFADILRPE